ncbi:hypothetical protein COU01_02350 [Candidatus Falkowbacteria bacterium CG10_big_fil_rev_8_21_14_0_10_44_15]|uniref:prephenate dehydratase n=1 Tax=Candidatus Falkowbacteria bacterium CG10_big_fil_rev_8_21_14_0_10_44_15 TaxID=1974569 RepID=A0A2H0UZV1_9BACT|nr:MAG: hypothetical protein COU01_02350 [Candidatus Falkowbacteria bacterium CG10_big_fil_rev_8_21_14_0_10_44_15]
MKSQNGVNAILALGPGTNGHEAALRAKAMLGLNGCKITFHPSHQEILSAMNGGANDRIAIVAIENSTQGYVREVVQHWLPCVLNGASPPDFNVIGEVRIVIKHCLLARKNITGAHELTGVMSHPQALGQCGIWLRQQRLTLQVPAESTARAAEIVATDTAYSRYGAIGSGLAAELYGLRVLVSGITDNNLYGENITRFYILGKQPAAKTGRDYTALLVKVPNVSGELHRITGAIAGNGINMTSLHSIPAGKLGDYVFYIEMEGHIEDRIVEVALASITNITDNHLVVLGSFPQANV